MFQKFDATSSPEHGPARLRALREEMAHQNLKGFLVPRADAHQGEYVAACDDRLAWLTSFTGSAGFAAILPDIAGVFIDGRYRVQVRQQVDPVFTPVHWPEVTLADWLKDTLSEGSIGFDPWLHTMGQIESLEKALAGSGLWLHPCPNLVDAIWEDRPEAPREKAEVHPPEYAGETHASKRKRLAATLREAGDSAAVITLPDSLCWLLNIRGKDIPRNPVMHGFAILHNDGYVEVFTEPVKLEHLETHLGTEVELRRPEALVGALRALEGSVRLEKNTVPFAIASALASAGVQIRYDSDPCALPKACKNAKEITGSVEAHLRDGAAVVNFLHWFDTQNQEQLTEIDVVRALEEKRRDTNKLRDISFETISGAGPNGAVIHYRVTHETNRQLGKGELLVLDSGGQYLDGTTDITRTLAIGAPGEAERRAFTLVLKGMIAISKLRWPKGLSGREIEAIGRVPLWSAGMDFDHGLGHGVGSYLCVHEGPQRLSRLSEIPLEPGMILSNEPGYYLEDAFGIRIENLIVVEKADALPTGDAHREMLQFRTLTFAPIDTALIDVPLLTEEERNWLNSYHAACLEKLSGRLNEAPAAWLKAATAPI